MGSPTGMAWPPLVRVKHSVQPIPFTPAIACFCTLVPGHAAASAYLLSIALTICCSSCSAGAGGLCAPLAIVITPSPSGLWSVTDVSSLFTTCQPSGTATVSPLVDTLEAPVGCEVGDGE